MNCHRAAMLLALFTLAGCGDGSPSRSTPPQTAGSVPGSGGDNSASGKAVFVAYNAPTIFAYDQTSMVRIGEIKTPGPNVVALALSPDAQTLYAAIGSYLASCSNKTTSLLSIDAKSMTTSRTVQLTGQITDLKESNNESVLVAVVVAQGRSDLYVFDPKSLSVIEKIALEPLDRHTYVGTFFSIPIFDTATANQTWSIGLGSTASLYDNFEETTDKRTIVVGGLDTSAPNNLAQGTVIDSASSRIMLQFMVNSLAFNMGAVNSAGTEASFYTRGNGPLVINAYSVMTGPFVAATTISDPNALVLGVAAQ